MISYKIRTWASLLLLGVILLHSAIRAQEKKERDAVKQPNIDNLIKALGAENYSKREDAYLKLKSKGKAIVPELRRRLATANDTEIKERLKNIIASHQVLVAKISPAHIKATVATRGLKNDPSIIILDGTRSRAKNGESLKYQWKQVDGDELELKSESLNRSRVGLKIYHPGNYRFQLIVSVGEAKSAPAFLDIEVKKKAEKAKGK